MDNKDIFLILLLLVMVISFLIYKSQDMKRIYRAKVLEGLNRTGASENPILTENDIKHLPEPVQKYLAYAGVIGKEKVQNARITIQGKMKLDPQKDWIQIKSEQYNFFDHPTRLFLIQGNMFGMPIIGLHAYAHGKANMLIKLAGLLTVADAKGEEMDTGETVTVFNDMCLMAPASLIDKRIHWETIDSLTVKAVFENNGCKISAVLYFNDKGELINFVSDDRSLTTNGNTYQKARWSTPVKDYKEINGIKRPTYGEAIWNLPEGDYCYAKFSLKDVAYNLSVTPPAGQD